MLRTHGQNVAESVFGGVQVGFFLKKGMAQDHGVVLTGTEVKSLREGHASLADAFATVDDGEVWLRNLHIPEYQHGSWTNHEPRRNRKLLLHRHQIDALIGKIEATLRARGLAQNTYIVFSSDNGYHMGEHLLNPGKMTAFDSDVRVPLIVAGPGAGTKLEKAQKLKVAVLDEEQFLALVPK